MVKKSCIEWHQYLRNEQKFSGIEELVAQIEKDKQNAIEYFEKNRQSSDMLKQVLFKISTCFLT